MRELRQLLLRRLDDARVRVADVQTADAAGEVDEGVAVDIGERGAAAFLDHNRKKNRQRFGDDLVLAGQDLARLRPRNGRLQLDRSSHCHGSDDTRAPGRNA